MAIRFNREGKLLTMAPMIAVMVLVVCLCLCVTVIAWSERFVHRRGILPVVVASLLLVAFLAQSSSVKLIDPLWCTMVAEESVAAATAATAGQLALTNKTLAAMANATVACNATETDRPLGQALSADYITLHTKVTAGDVNKVAQVHTAASTAKVQRERPPATVGKY